MKKTIWIVDHNSSEPEHGGYSRQYDFAVELGKREYNVVVIASGFSHFTHEYIVEEGHDLKVSAVSDHVHYVYLRTSSYKENNGGGRARNIIDFMCKVIKYEAVISQKYGRPDVVTGCSVHPLTWIAAYKIARKYKIRFIAEIRDFWPQWWIASGKMKRTHPVAVFFALIEKWAFRHADGIICSLEHGDDYICEEKGVPRSKVRIIGQPVDCERFDKSRERLDLLPQDLRKFMEGGFVCAFAGYFVKYEGVFVMLEAMKLLQQEDIPVKMVFVGSGQEKDSMLQVAAKNQLKNVYIGDRISKEAVLALVSHSDICIAHMEAENKGEAYKYGVSKNKLTEYLYSGACTLFGYKYMNNEVVESGGGLVFEPYNAKDLAEKIKTVYYLPVEERKEFGVRGRTFMREKHDVEKLTDNMLEMLFETKLKKEYTK